MEETHDTEGRQAGKQGSYMSHSDGNNPLHLSTHPAHGHGRSYCAKSEPAISNLPANLSTEIDSYAYTALRHYDVAAAAGRVGGLHF